MKRVGAYPPPGFWHFYDRMHLDIDENFQLDGLAIMAQAGTGTTHQAMGPAISDSSWWFAVHSIDEKDWGGIPSWAR